MGIAWDQFAARNPDLMQSSPSVLSQCHSGADLASPEARQTFAVHPGGLRDHGSAPLVRHVLSEGPIEAEAYRQSGVFESAVKFACCEETIPAPESAHAIHSVIVHALRAREKGRALVILFNLSGHGHFDLGAYESQLAGTMDANA